MKEDDEVDWDEKASSYSGSAPGLMPQGLSAKGKMAGLIGIQGYVAANFGKDDLDENEASPAVSHLVGGVFRGDWTNARRWFAGRR